MNKKYKLPHRYKLLITPVLIVFSLLALLPTSCTCNCTPEGDIFGGGYRPDLLINHNRLVFTSSRDGNEQGDIYMTDLDGQNLVKINDDPLFGYRTVWSPTGKRIAFITRAETSGIEPTTTLHIVDDGGNSVVAIEGFPSEFSQFDWSPDGKTLAFYYPSNDDNTFDLYTVDSDGIDFNAIATVPGRNVENISWSPDSAKILFVSDQIENHNNNIIRVVDSDGSNLIAIDDAQRYGFESAWSPDSGKIAYIKSDNDSGGDISDIYIANADGTGRINITNGDYGRAMRVSWSSDGQKITFQALSSASQMDPPDSYRVNADGTGLTKTTSTINGESAYEIMPSPDGKRTLLAVIDDETTTEYLIYLADADGRNPVRIMENVQEYISGYTWAPNSSKFAYSTRGHDVDNPDGRDTNAHNIYVVNADGTGLVELASVTTDGNSYSSGPGWFVWSPDSTRIIFPNTIDDNLDIFSVRADGTGLVNITNSPGSDWGPILPR